MTQQTQAVTLDPAVFHGVLEVFDLIRAGHKPKKIPAIDRISSQLELLTAGGVNSFSRRNRSVLEVFRSIILSERISWMTLPKNRPINDQHVFDFVRSFRKKLLAIKNLTEEVRMILERICRTLVEKLPIPTTA